MLEGDLTDFTLPDILQLLAYTSKSGRLSLEDGDERGRIDLLKGRVRDASADAGRLPLVRRLLGRGLLDADAVRAVLDDHDRLPTDLEVARALVARDLVASGDVAEALREQTLDAVFDLRRWSNGSFRFAAVDGDEDSPADLALAVDELLEEVDRRLASWEDVLDRSGADDVVVSLTRPDDAEIAVPREGWELLGLIDGHRTVSELARLSGRGQYATRRSLVDLLELGVVHLGAVDGPGSVAHLVQQHHELAELEAALGGGPTLAPVAPAWAAGTAAGASTVDPAVVTAAREDVGEVPSDAAPPATDHLGDPELDAPDGAPGDEVGEQRLKVRTARLRPDPTIDADVVERLIAGVEQL